MLFLACLMGMMAIGAIVFISLTPAHQDDSDTDTDAPDQGMAVEADITARENGTSLSDCILTNEEDLQTSERADGSAADDAVADMISEPRNNESPVGPGDATPIGGSAGDGAGNDVLSGCDSNNVLHDGRLNNDLLPDGRDQSTPFGDWGDDTLSKPKPDPDAGGRVDTDNMDHFDSGPGHDKIIAGANDVITTDDSADTVFPGPWLEAADQAEILDFSPDEDRLMIIYDDAQNSMPDVGLLPDLDNTDLQHITLDGIRIAAVNNALGLSLDHITLVGHSQLPSEAMF